MVVIIVIVTTLLLCETIAETWEQGSLVELIVPEIHRFCSVLDTGDPNFHSPTLSLSRSRVWWSDCDGHHSAAGAGETDSSSPTTCE